MRLLSSVMLAASLVGAAALPARADEGPRADVAGGYSLIYDHDAKTTFPAGWFVSAAVNATNAFAVAAEVSGHYKSGSAGSSMNVHALLAGPRLIAGTGAARFFGQFLVGAAVSSPRTETTDLCFMPAVGLDIGFNPKTAMRIGAGERWIRVAGGSTSPQFQFVAGLVHRFEK